MGSLYRIDPYKKPPKQPTIALLTKDGLVTDECGGFIDLDDYPRDTITYCDYDTARHLTLSGVGQSLQYNLEEIRWRHRSFDEDWKNRPSDVTVIKFPFPDSVEKALAGLVTWRDWLANYGAAPIGPVASASWSLLRATLPRPLHINKGEPPPLIQTFGGRIELGINGPGHYEGNIEQVDLPAAYAKGLSELAYNGRWIKAPSYHSKLSSLEFWGREDRATFARARVRIPERMYGVLLDRPNKVMKGMLFGRITYPKHGCELENIWTGAELLSAQYFGADILEVQDVWYHASRGDYIFSNWWQAILEGRQLPGIAKHLAKMTGNTLWGRFCMDANSGKKHIVYREKGKERLVHLKLQMKGGRIPDHSLADTISGRVRAKLGYIMHSAGDKLLTANTDGAWIVDNNLDIPSEWRVKKKASRFDLITPQRYRFWPDVLHDPEVVMAGYPSSMTADAFEQSWQRNMRLWNAKV